MNNTSKLWIDVSDIYMCKHSMTGIPRVVYELAIRFSNYKNKEIGFFIYDDIKKVCTEIAFENIFTDLLSKGSKRNKRDILHNFSKKIFKSLNLNYLKYKKCETSKLEKNIDFIRYDSLIKAPFKDNDIVFVIGSSWNSISKMHDLMNLKYSLNLKYIQIIYDLIPSFHPQLFGPGFAAQFNSSIFESIANADLLICISKATKQDVLNFCDITKIKPNSIEVVRLGDDYTQHSSPKKPKTSLADNEEFILCLGTLESRKNQALLYYVVKEALYKKIKIPKIIIAGRSGWLVQDLVYLLKTDCMLKDKLLYLGEVTDEEKTWLYQNCRFTIYPSVYEGWGLPVAESLFYGKPCLTSSISSMPEIGGHLVDYFSPFDSGECLQKIVEYSSDDILFNKIGQIKTSYRTFSWDDTFQQVAAYISKL